MFSSFSENFEVKLPDKEKNEKKETNKKERNNQT